MTKRLGILVGGAAIAMGASLAVAAPAFEETVGYYNNKTVCQQQGAKIVNAAPGALTTFTCIGNGNPTTDSPRWELRVY